MYILKNIIRLFLIALFVQVIQIKQLNAEIIFIQENSLEDLWNKYNIIVGTDDRNRHVDEASSVKYRIIGSTNDEINDLITSDWRFKNLTYQLYYDNQAVMATDLYILAIFIKDISETVTLERFQKGVQGFHYSTQQICDWLNDSSTDLSSNNLHNYFIEDGVIKQLDNKFISTGKFEHVLGVAYNPKRKMSSIVMHESFHILWDEDKSVRNYYVNLWNSYNIDEKNTIISGLKGYSLENEEQLVEEWAVREMEKFVTNQ
jgi:hypothetical protein